MIIYRWLYDIMAYFFFFFNVIFAFVMCLLRGVGVVIFTAIMLFRLDWDVYMRGLEGWDMGKICNWLVTHLAIMLLLLSL